jgi:hypothetical protein
MWPKLLPCQRHCRCWSVLPCRTRHSFQDLSRTVLFSSTVTVLTQLHPSSSLLNPTILEIPTFPDFTFTVSGLIASNLNSLFHCYEAPSTIHVNHGNQHVHEHLRGCSRPPWSCAAPIEQGGISREAKADVLAGNRLCNRKPTVFCTF